MGNINNIFFLDLIFKVKNELFENNIVLISYGYITISKIYPIIIRIIEKINMRKSTYNR